MYQPVVGDSSLCASEGTNLKSLRVALNGRVVVLLGEESVSLGFELISTPKTCSIIMYVCISEPVTTPVYISTYKATDTLAFTRVGG